MTAFGELSMIVGGGGYKHICSECGAVLVLMKGPGRLRSYRGEGGYEVPADFVIPTCLACGAEWLSDSDIEILSQALESQRDQRKALADSHSDPSTQT